RLILRHRHDRAPVERTPEEQIERTGHRQPDHARDEVAEGDADARELDRLADVAGLHEPVVDAELQAEADLQDEEDAEEEHEPAQRLLASSLEAAVVDAIDGGADQVEDRREEDSGEDRVEPEALVHDV